MSDIPANYKKYFWDVQLDTIDIEKNKQYVIERISEYGDLESLSWINSIYDKNEIIKTIKNSRRISPKTGNYFAVYYGFPKSELRCMKTPSILKPRKF